MKRNGFSLQNSICLPLNFNPVFYTWYIEITFAKKCKKITKSDFPYALAEDPARANAVVVRNDFSADRFGFSTVSISNKGCSQLHLLMKHRKYIIVKRRAGFLCKVTAVKNILFVYTSAETRSHSFQIWLYNHPKWLPLTKQGSMKNTGCVTALLYH